MFVLIWYVNGLCGYFRTHEPSPQIHVVLVIVKVFFADLSTVNWVPLWVLLVSSKLFLDFLYFLVDLFQGLLEWSLVEFFFIHLTNHIVLGLGFLISEEVTEVVVFGSSGSVNSLFNELSPDFFFQIIFFGMGETDSEELDQLEFTFNFEFLNKRHE